MNEKRLRFAEQRRNAKRRGILWQLTFAEWWTLWQESGQWENRGRLRGQFCMSRFGDQGPYALDNIFIQERTANDREREGSRSPQQLRARVVRGSRHRWAVLNEEQVAEIRRRLADGERGRDLAAEFHVRETAISNIKHNRTWRAFHNA